MVTVSNWQTDTVFTSLRLLLSFHFHASNTIMLFIYNTLSELENCSKIQNSSVRPSSLIPHPSFFIPHPSSFILQLLSFLACFMNNKESQSLTYRLRRQKWPIIFSGFWSIYTNLWTPHIFYLIALGLTILKWGEPSL